MYVHGNPPMSLHRYQALAVSKEEKEGEANTLEELTIHGIHTSAATVVCTADDVTLPN
jgi:hypothetical protein